MPRLSPTDTVVRHSTGRSAAASYRELLPRNFTIESAVISTRANITKGGWKWQQRAVHNDRLSTIFLDGGTILGNEEKALTTAMVGHQETLRAS